MHPARLAYLVRRHYDRMCTAAETEELMGILRSGAGDAELDALLQELMEEHAVDAALPPERREAAFDRFRRSTGALRVRRLFRWAAAAAVLVAIAATGLLMLQRQPETVPKPLVADISPATDRALLTLADGSTVPLDSAGHMVLQQEDTRIRQSGGMLEYDAQADGGPVQYNTLRTPRGGIFRIQLPDGTRVWLNAASTIRYPTAFGGGLREVEMTGEAYFEVAKDAKAPFRVKLPAGAAVEVLGTHFNIHAYEDVKDLTTTLTEGAVRVSHGQQAVTLAPNQQAVVRPYAGGSPIAVLQQANTERVLAWKNGLFHFDNEPFAEVMRQLSRWYDVDVEYRGAVPVKKFSGELQRNLSLLQVLEIMKEMNIGVRLEEGRKLVVTP